MQRVSESALRTRPKAVRFTLFTSDDIHKLAVCEIISSMSFDLLGHPLAGGLYDKRLGPATDHSDPCGTCHQNFLTCPGHFGYIPLPLPVVHPLFHKVIALLLRCSCMSCFNMQISGAIKYLLDVQTKLLNRGLLVEAENIAEIMQDIMGRQETIAEVPENTLAVVQEYETLVKQVPVDANNGNKNIENLRNKMQHAVWKGIRVGRKCLYCKAQPTKITAIRQKLIVVERQDVDDSKSSMSGSIKAAISKPITPEKSREYVRRMWAADAATLKNLFPVLQGIKSEYPTDAFFMDVVAVPPCNVRPLNVVAGKVSEHPQTANYKRILQTALLLRAVMRVMRNSERGVECLPPEARAAYAATHGSTPAEKLSVAWDQLQADVDAIVDNAGKLSGEQGLKQIIEKKAGIIRQHMMGKRVNYAARSVITPDPNLNIDEIGVPEIFAKHLTYPVPVTTWNVTEMRQLILNGPKKHPGAVMVEFEDGRAFRVSDDLATRQALLKRLLTPDGPERGFRGLKTVYRHLRNGDALLLNRQPTLHRPSIMAHTARVLRDEKTLRLHYANCKAYNADFDGDEMNAHFPQNELARAEAYHVANVANQYLGPKDGAPLSGLIQDHVISGVKMSMRGRFFGRMDYQQLCYQALASNMERIRQLPPAIVKPQELWSGKQVLSTVLLNVIPRGRAPLNLSAVAKIPPTAWITAEPRAWKCGVAFANEKAMSEAEVVIRGGELLAGVLDKVHYGATSYGLVHCVYELYGGACAIKLLSALAKLFTGFLQTVGFTLGVEDILLRPEAEAARAAVIRKARGIGVRTMRTALNMPDAENASELAGELERQAATDPKLRAAVDRAYKSALDPLTNAANAACLPAGLVARFPRNNLQLMVASGAKGSIVNAMQISCLLGQIELEGRRPPTMISGRTLPSFPAEDVSPRAGGYVDGRFMTGLRPQEFFFHCMAGREGLIDTAVKTSRSGYLQRCLVKHLEGVRVAYDLTVRDSDHSVIQFCYGEDGMDVCKAPFLTGAQLPFLADNARAIAGGGGGDAAIERLKQRGTAAHAQMRAHRRELAEWRAASGSGGNSDLLSTNVAPFTLFSAAVRDKAVQSLGDEARALIARTGRTRLAQCIVDLWCAASADTRAFFAGARRRAPPPLASRLRPDAHFGVLNERLEALVKHAGRAPGVRDALRLKAMQALAPPGEPVGLLAAQSIGEPSTQMTLNTFHFAGRGEMNVTLGIPRLREILLTASKTPKTPSMEVPFLADAVDLEARAVKLLRVLTRVTVADVLEKIAVSHQLVHGPVRHFRYVLRFHFLPRELYEERYNVTPKRILKYMKVHFFRIMFFEIRRRAKMRSELANVSDAPKAKPKRRAGGEEEEEEEDGDADASADGKRQEAADLDDATSEDEPDDPEDAKSMSKFRSANDAQEDDEDAASEDDATDTADVAESDAEAHAMDDGAPECGAADQLVEGYAYDTDAHKWCELTFRLPLGQRQFDLTAMLRHVAGKAVLWETPNVRRAIAYSENGRRMLRTDGVNFSALNQYADLLDLRRLYSNDIHRVAGAYGVEAAARVVVREVRDVFKAYGIGVDARHLSLIADYMTFGGSFEPLNRTSMEASASPLQQMSFEAALTFLRTAVLGGKCDALKNPSACLMLGKPCAIGTGACGVLCDLRAFLNPDAR